MTPQLDQFFSQWRIYKRTLIFFFAVNVFSVVFAIVLAAKYISSHSTLAKKQTHLISQIENIEKTQFALKTLQNKLSQRKKIEIRTREDEKQVLSILSDWQELRTYSAQIEGVVLNYEFSSLIDTVEAQTEIQKYDKGLESAKVLLWQKMKAQISDFNFTTQLIIITGVITLLFGLILPTIISSYMGRALNNARKEMQNAALEFIKAWGEAKAGMGEDAFKNVEFWLQILLLVGQQTSRLSSHPAAQITGELAYLVRIELQKSAASKAA
jgi:Sec-independent protein translocase protein TatA/cell division protein FtsB